MAAVGLAPRRGGCGARAHHGGAVRTNCSRSHSRVCKTGIAAHENILLYIVTLYTACLPPIDLVTMAVRAREMNADAEAAKMGCVRRHRDSSLSSSPHQQIVDIETHERYSLISNCALHCADRLPLPRRSVGGSSGAAMPAAAAACGGGGDAASCAHQRAGINHRGYLLQLTPKHEQDHWPKFEAKLRAQGLGDAAVAAFKSNYDQLTAGVTGMVRCSLWGTAGTRSDIFRSQTCSALEQAACGSDPAPRPLH